MIKKKSFEAIIVSYYLSRFNESAYKEIGRLLSRELQKKIFSFSEIHNELGVIFDVKSSYIKNMRDAFDPYHENNRKGWWQRKLRPLQQNVYNQYCTKSKGQISKEVGFFVEKRIRIKNRREKKDINQSLLSKMSHSDLMTLIKHAKDRDDIILLQGIDLVLKERSAKSGQFVSNELRDVISSFKDEHINASVVLDESKLSAKYTDALPEIKKCSLKDDVIKFFRESNLVLVDNIPDSENKMIKMSCGFCLEHFEKSFNEVKQDSRCPICKV